jgi:hypothetical protein
MFNAIKTLLKGGATQGEAASYMGISGNTVNRIAKAETFEEYTNIAYANGCGKGVPKGGLLTDDKQSGGTISANYQINRIYELLKTQNETLTIISNKLAFIVDELCGTAKK